MTFRSVPWTSQPQGSVPALRNGVKASSIFVPNASLYGALHSTHFIGTVAGGRELVMPFSPAQAVSAGHGNVSFSAEWTIVCVYRRNAEDLGWSRAFSAGSESATSAVFGLAYGYAGYSLGQLYIVVSGSNASTVANYSPTDTDPVGVVSVQVFTCKDGVVTSWKNGWLKVAGATANIGSVNAGQMYLGSQVEGRSGGFSILGLITLPYGLSDRDGRDLSANPWQIFQPRKLPIFVDIPVDHNIYAYSDESAITTETSEYPSTGSVFNDSSQDTNSSAESSSVLVNLSAASTEPSISQEYNTSQAMLQSVRADTNASQESSTSQATLQSVLIEFNASQDAQTQGATSSNTITDINSVTDSSTKVYTAQTTLNDTNSVVDTQTAQAQLYAARSEVNNAVESMSALAQLYAAKTESSSATETSTQGASSSNSTTDSTSVTDSSTGAYTSQATLSDNNTSTDSTTVQAQFYAAKTETATTLDSLLAQASLLAVKLETTSPTDSRTTSTTFVAAQLNTVNIIDTYAAIASLTAQLHTISNSIEVLLSNSVSSANILEITIALDDFYALLEQLIYQLSQVVFMNETLAFTLIPISRTTSLRAETNAPLDVPAIRLNQFLATKPITTYIRT